MEVEFVIFSRGLGLLWVYENSFVFEQNHEIHVEMILAAQFEHVWTTHKSQKSNPNNLFNCNNL